MTTEAFSIVTADQPLNQGALAEVAAAKARRKARRVTVLLGGISSEREVSLSSGAAACKALEAAGYQVKAIDVTRDIATVVHDLDRTRPDVVFNALHGRYGEDGCVQGILNILGLPYTHSGLLASAIAMDKPAAKRLFADAGIAIAEDRVVTREQVLAGDPLPRPYVLKPLNEGSSVGVIIVREGANAHPLADHSWPYGATVMAEAFIPGREMTVAVMGDHALAVTEIATDRDFYDYDAKYAPGGSRHTLPAPVDPEVYAEAQRVAIKAHRALGCRGVSRADIRFDGSRMVILEVNTQPGMTPTSLVPEQAQLAGISFPDLCTWMVETATCDA
ncbi:D-alanine--D-alanine ligase [Novispirillum sp. DQ9]|uniref:D-alanine--D-alanine ligase n=1 Tax=Novispirillum sp. DQ9 TaxID=3398612 RepID=UPI003C7EBF72